MNPAKDNRALAAIERGLKRDDPEWVVRILSLNELIADGPSPRRQARSPARKVGCRLVVTVLPVVVLFLGLLIVTMRAE